MTYLKPLLPFLAGSVFLLLIGDFFAIAVSNLLLQLLLFTLVVCIPAWRTHRLSYVDIGWPFGLALIGALAILLGEGDWLRKLLIGGIYLFIGLRMGIGALRMLQRGYFNTEFPRYQYQRLRWEKRGIKNTRLIMQIEALVQGLANASFLAFPAFVVAMNPTAQIHPIEILATLLWLLAFSMETLADMQKLSFARAMKKSGKRNTVCNVGLWRYSRHPNYFAEWMVWNALVLMSLPSLFYFFGTHPAWQTLLYGIGLYYCSYIMYKTLVYYTGAIPSEYYSLQKRPDYKNYQATTSRFFPKPPRRQ